MKFQKCVDVKKLESICKNSGSNRVKKTCAYPRYAQWTGKEKFYAETYGEVAFFAGNFGKLHFNLIEFAVVEDKHGEGIGRIVANRMKQVCKEKGKEKIRLRTAIDETAVDFWQKMGAEIVGLKGDDYVMEIHL